MLSTETSSVLPAVAVCDVICSIVTRLQLQLPNAFMVISGDFNHASLCYISYFPAKTPGEGAAWMELFGLRDEATEDMVRWKQMI